ELEDYKLASTYSNRPEDCEPISVYSDRHEEYEPTPTCQNELKVGKTNQANNYKVVSTK
ncbi:19433_t:CDS:1, partial [Racocetra persica]